MNPSMKQKETHDTENRLVIGKGVGAGGSGDGVASWD